ncbi:MAG: ABC transporter substrate-binding protein [Pleurocapsa sp. SU_196_0]|nr:ABC transporter substrate-binding protein [Pleurocapsa sp. SU_196_0]
MSLFRGIAYIVLGFFALMYGFFFYSLLLYFDRQNAGGGVNGRKISLVIGDDGYEPNKAVDETLKMIEQEKPIGH